MNQRVNFLRMTVIALLILLISGCSGERRAPAPDKSDLQQPKNLSAAERGIHKATEYLWQQQSEDGGWHSQTYGLLQSGQSLTPFVLNIVLQVPDQLYATPVDKVDRAIAFIKRHTDKDGAVGRADAKLEDYPNYATALAVQALASARRPGWQETIAPMVACLRRQQFTEERGWARAHPVYGAWGMGGERRTPPETGHVDISMTRHVLQALQAARLATDDPVFERARIFLSRCQNYDPKNPLRGDGGFFFSTVIVDANKAGHDGTHYRSYGTATADGILALLAAGVSAQDARVQAATRWLAEHHMARGVPGFSEGTGMRWTEAMRFYYAAASAQAFNRLNVRSVRDGAPWSQSLLSQLLNTQRPDGSWINSAILMKEDDPFIATVFAVSALLNT